MKELRKTVTVVLLVAIFCYVWYRAGMWAHAVGGLVAVLTHVGF